MLPVIHSYKLRLTNLSQGNRSLKLGTLSVRKDVDLTTTSFFNKLSAEEILTKLISGKSVDVLKTLNPSDPAAAQLDKRLTQVYREVSNLYEETGAYDLFLGYPFVEGRFADGGIARCPLVLFPIRLERDFEHSPRWRISVPETEDVSFNKTFFLAYEKFMQVRLPKAFWETELEHFETIQDLLNHVYGLFRELEIPLNFNSQLFQFKVIPFDDKHTALLEQMPIGQLKCQPYAVMGVFPQSDSALLQDYEALSRAPEAFPLEQVMRVQGSRKSEAYVKEDERFLVTAVDQSQEEALLQVRAGNSIVVHGPPGTGKSQVILNLIADALAHGQRVLVCSQKRAALDVVYQRLSELGLGPFAALVHDFRADRDKIYQQIGRQVDLLEQYRQAQTDVSVDKWLRDFRLDARRLDELNQFFAELHAAQTQVGRFGLSAHQLYLMADSDLQCLPIVEVAKHLDYEELKSVLAGLKDVLAYRALYNPVHPWRYRLSFKGYSLSAKEQLLAQVDRLGLEVQELHLAWQDCLPLGLKPELDALGKVAHEWHTLAAFFQPAYVAEDYAAFHLDKQRVEGVRKHLKELKGIFERMAGFQILEGFPLNLYADLSRHFKVYSAKQEALGRFLSLDWLKGHWYLKRILKHKGRSFDDAGWALLVREFKELEGFMVAWRELDGYAFFKDMPVLDGPQALLAWHERKSVSLLAIEAAKQYVGPKILAPGLHKEGFDHSKWAAGGELIRAMEDFQKLLKAALTRWRVWLHEKQVSSLLAGIVHPDNIRFGLEAMRNSLARDFEQLRDLDSFLQGWGVDQRSLLNVVEDGIWEQESPEHQKAWLKQIENSVLLVWIEQMEREAPILAEASSPRMLSRREDFAAKVKARQESAVALITQRLQKHILELEEYNRLGNPVTYREIARQVKKQRRLWPLRKLVSEHWNEGLSRLLPCWMASPESVAAIFPMEAGFFDLVIFDEASQCYVERALPVIMRGHTTVIAGDDKQLQPFDLYNVKVETSEEAFAENEMAMEVESVLDLARNVYPACNLNWHYRSREEELIQFSNHLFYDGRLNVMPSAQADRAFQPPLEFVPVEGLWHQNQNVAEATKVLELIEAYVMHPAQPTIGVVTFNHPQMELIKDLLEQRLQVLLNAGESVLRSRLQQAMERGEGEERQGIFVKNIENVQGDERDVIIFSVGYAHNAEGKLMANFGLLNQKGGENRLNVAVSRARRKVVVACSFDPSMLEVAHAQNEGPRMLKRYLAYVQGVSAGQGIGALKALGVGSSEGAGTSVGRAALADLVAGRLTALGLKVERDIGDTGFKVDLAIVDAQGSYVLGIECEGDMYFGGKSSKEREVYRQQLLEARGWRIYRVWARSYFLNPKKVETEILGELERKLRGES